MTWLEKLIWCITYGNGWGYAVLETGGKLDSSTVLPALTLVQRLVITCNLRSLCTGAFLSQLMPLVPPEVLGRRIPRQ